jgi:undecaprenyl-diphosphatase
MNMNSGYKFLIISGLLLALGTTGFALAGYLEQPGAWERQWFGWINHPQGWSLVDSFAILFRTPGTWLPIYALLLLWVFRSKVERPFNLILVLVVSVALSDQISSSLIKPLVQRDRPCRHPLTAAECQIRVTCGSGYGFVSSHAANHFALAWALGWALRARWGKAGLWIGSVWAGLVCIAQIRVGVHFPGDVLVGALIGLFCASVALLLRREG